MYTYIIISYFILRMEGTEPVNTAMIEWPLHTIDLVRDVLVFLEKHVQLTDAYPQITVSELVGNVEPQSPELSPLQSNTVE